MAAVTRCVAEKITIVTRIEELNDDDKPIKFDYKNKEEYYLDELRSKFATDKEKESGELPNRRVTLKLARIDYMNKHKLKFDDIDNVRLFSESVANDVTDEARV